MESVAQRLSRIRREVDGIARACGRDPAEITLVAATKTQNRETIRAAIAAGITVCGENRVQELTAHLEPSRYIGRCPEQVTQFLSEEVAPVLERYADALDGSKAELSV